MNGAGVVRHHRRANAVEAARLAAGMDPFAVLHRWVPIDTQYRGGEPVDRTEAMGAGHGVVVARATRDHAGDGWRTSTTFCLGVSLEELCGDLVPDEVPGDMAATGQDTDRSGHDPAVGARPMVADRAYRRRLLGMLEACTRDPESWEVRPVAIPTAHAELVNRETGGSHIDGGCVPEADATLLAEGPRAIIALGRLVSQLEGALECVSNRGVCPASRSRAVPSWTTQSASV